MYSPWVTEKGKCFSYKSSFCLKKKKKKERKKRKMDLKALPDLSKVQVTENSKDMKHSSV